MIVSYLGSIETARDEATGQQRLEFEQCELSWQAFQRHCAWYSPVIRRWLEMHSGCFGMVELALATALLRFNLCEVRWATLNKTMLKLPPAPISSYVPPHQHMKAGGPKLAQA